MSDQAPHRALRHNQTAIQYWGLGYQSYLWLREITAHLKWRGAAPDTQAQSDRYTVLGGWAISHTFGCERLPLTSSAGAALQPGKQTASAQSRRAAHQLSP